MTPLTVPTQCVSMLVHQLGSHMASKGGYFCALRYWCLLQVRMLYVTLKICNHEQGHLVCQRLTSNQLRTDPRGKSLETSRLVES